VKRKQYMKPEKLRNCVGRESAPPTRAPTEHARLAVHLTVRGPSDCSTAVRSFALFPSVLGSFIGPLFFFEIVSKIFLFMKVHGFLLKARQSTL